MVVTNYPVELTLQKIAVMQAFLDGTPIEYRPKQIRDGKWSPIKHPTWNWHAIEYRIVDKR